MPDSAIDVIGQISNQHHAPEAIYLIDGVPTYLWYNGCGPTALAMVLGYYDTHGFDEIFIGSASTQTPAVESAIASTGNYNDYCLPEDYYPNLLADLSELPAGDEHSDNCIADYMLTSRSVYGNYYGWSWSSDIGYAFSNYLDNQTPYSGSWTSVYPDFYTWEQYKAEIDANKPMMALVDTDGNGSTDHFITLVAYKEESGINYYGCYQTWDSNLHWYEYAAIAPGQAWGVYCFFTFLMQSSGLDENLQSKILVYPNPAIDFITIELQDGVSIQKISIYTAEGALVAEKTDCEQQSSMLNISTLNDGCFIIEVLDEQNNLTRKVFIKQH